MVEPVSAVLTGIALVTKSVEFVKKNISTCQDIGELISHVENAFEGQKKVIKEREKSGADPFSTQEVAKEVINARLAQEALYEMKQLINLRFGHGTWEYILEERKKRIDKRKKAIKEARAKAHKKQQEIIEYVKWGFIAIATIAKPLNRPKARYWFITALKIGTPNPLTPIIDAITTIARAIIIVWLTPAKTVGNAKGI